MVCIVSGIGYLQVSDRKTRKSDGVNDTSEYKTSIVDGCV